MTGHRFEDGSRGRPVMAGVLLKVRIADIAVAAEVSRQAVYLHFGNRANLLLLAAVQYRDSLSPTASIRRAAGGAR